MTDEPLLRKLQVKNGRSLRLVAAPDEYLERILPLPEASEMITTGEADVVQVFVGSKADVDERAPAGIAALAPGGVLWITYPKRTSKMASDVTRDTGWEALAEAGWRPVAQISIDEVWSAIRFRPEEDVTPRAR